MRFKVHIGPPEIVLKLYYDVSGYNSVLEIQLCKSLKQFSEFCFIGNSDSKSFKQYLTHILF